MKYMASAVAAIAFLTVSVSAAPLVESTKPADLSADLAAKGDSTHSSSESLVSFAADKTKQVVDEAKKVADVSAAMIAPADAKDAAEKKDEAKQAEDKAETTEADEKAVTAAPAPSEKDSAVAEAALKDDEWLAIPEAEVSSIPPKAVALLREQLTSVMDVNGLALTVAKRETAADGAQEATTVYRFTLTDKAIAANQMVVDVTLFENGHHVSYTTRCDERHPASALCRPTKQVTDAFSDHRRQMDFYQQQMEQQMQSAFGGRRFGGHPRMRSARPYYF